MSRLKLVTVSLLSAALVLGALVVGARGEAGKKNTKGKKGFAAEIDALKKVNATLHQADHDYKGHRAKAMEKIHHAIHVLRHGAKGSPDKYKAPKATGKTPQDKSDAALAGALQQVIAVHGQLSSHKAARAKKAAHLLHQARGHLETALKTK